MTIKVFNSPEEIFAELDAQAQQARKMLEGPLGKWLEEFHDGDCYVSVSNGFPIFGKVLSSSYPEDAEPEAALRRDGYLPVKAWSAMCPHGEMGTEHISKFDFKISPQCLKTAKASNWPVDPLAIRMLFSMPGHLVAIRPH